ncbi:S1C family serine protease [Rubrivivax albus]|uniref:Trypsin-like serine protease n=1 Tax=Rubrivivax albus TaxID=2499835 RepID=A0A3S2WQS5_9BURK|nr:trypsin-like peptidase domain-containing protein [Rubrivivax albus]RVT48430.1 trypsin-like serine protease [Rubrivivax albus]
MTLRPSRTLWAFAAGAVAALLAFTFPAASRTDAPAPRSVAPRGVLLPDEQATIDLFRRLSPSVVHITTLAAQRDFFSLNVQQVPRGTGTGFVWDTAGHVVTNFHVIQGGNAARVTLADQSTWDAKLVGAFPDRDLAVLKIDAPADKLPPIPLGSSKDLQVGQRVLAIGNPFGLDQTLTTGVVSALNREIESFNNRTIRGVVQTDAAINPGNSGGPLLDSAGRLIGVNTQIASPSGASAGIGFAIPADEVNRIVPRLIRDGRIVRPSLGITAGPPGLTRALRLPPGVTIIETQRGSPAARAELQPFRRGRDGGIVLGDVITEVDGQPVTDLDDVLTLLEARQTGDTVTLTLWNAGKTRQQRMRLADGGS